MSTTTAMILAAGYGQRLRPLTDQIAKPLIKFNRRSLIEHHLISLTSAGIKRVVINLHHLGEQIPKLIGDGGQFGVEIVYSWEREQALETAGGIRHALPLLGNDPFLVVNGDIRCDIDFSRLALRENMLMNLVLVANPPYRETGDFDLQIEGGIPLLTLPEPARRRYTFAGVGLYRPSLFSHLADNTKAPLAPIIRHYLGVKKVTASIHPGRWFDIGTPERLSQARQAEY